MTNLNNAQPVEDLECAVVNFVNGDGMPDAGVLVKMPPQMLEDLTQACDQSKAGAYPELNTPAHVVAWCLLELHRGWTTQQKLLEAKKRHDARVAAATPEQLAAFKKRGLRVT